MITIKEISKEYPKTSVICIDGYNVFYINHSPTSNCQIFSIGNTYQIIEHRKAISKILSTIYDFVGKPQFFIDIEKIIKKEIIAILEPYTIRIIETPYTNTTGTKMVLCIIQLNIDKL
jgi:hypothetical protein